MAATKGDAAKKKAGPKSSAVMQSSKGRRKSTGGGGGQDDDQQPPELQDSPTKFGPDDDDAAAAAAASAAAAAVSAPVSAPAPALDVRRANGKRVRRKHDPNSWAASIPTQRTNVLCLGVSYPFVKHQLIAEKINADVLHYSDPGVDQTVELVRRNILTEMDGRDLVRCLALEDGNDTLAYCVSLETGARYGPRHLHANFNRVKFISQMKKTWGKVKFRQIILDYFWIPRGTWVMSHWATAFFKTVLPSFVTEGMLDFSDGEANSRRVNSHLFAHSTSGYGGGVVYLPFCHHCIKEVTAAIKILSKYYCISFLYKSELAEHALWSATNSIDPEAMQSWFGKAIDQEEIYCTFTPQEVNSAADSAHISKADVLKVLRGIEDFENVRMIKLTALKKYDPEYRGSTTSGIVGVDKGGFVGLKKPSEVKRGFDSVGKAASKISPPVSSAEEDSSDEAEQGGTKKNKASSKRTKKSKKKAATAAGGSKSRASNVTPLASNSERNSKASKKNQSKSLCLVTPSPVTLEATSVSSASGSTSSDDASNLSFDDNVSRFDSRASGKSLTNNGRRNKVHLLPQQDALDIPDLNVPSTLSTLMGKTDLVKNEDKGLVQDYIFLAMSQLQRCTLGKADKVRKSTKDLDIGFLGLSCKHCGGAHGSGGKYFPVAVKSLSHQYMTKTIINHLGTNCPMCPPNIRRAIVALQSKADIEKALKAKETVGNRRPKYGSRKKFFQRVWERLHKGDEVPECIAAAITGKEVDMDSDGDGSYDDDDDEAREQLNGVRKFPCRCACGGPCAGASDDLLRNNYSCPTLKSTDVSDDDYRSESESLVSIDGAVTSSSSGDDCLPLNISDDDFRSESESLASIDGADASSSSGDIFFPLEMADVAGEEHAVEIPYLQLASGLGTLVRETNLVKNEDKDLVQDYLFLAMSQLQRCSYSEGDKSGKSKYHEIGFLGLCCKHCEGYHGDMGGRYFPATARSLAECSMSQRIVNHLGTKCPMCPPNIRSAIVALQSKADIEKALKAKETVGNRRPKYGSRKKFFQRVWERLHNGDGVSRISDSSTNAGKELHADISNGNVDDDIQEKIGVVPDKWQGQCACSGPCAGASGDLRHSNFPCPSLKSTDVSEDDCHSEEESIADTSPSPGYCGMASPERVKMRRLNDDSEDERTSMKAGLGPKQSGDHLDALISAASSISKGAKCTPKVKGGERKGRKSQKNENGSSTTIKSRKLGNKRKRSEELSCLERLSSQPIIDTSREIQRPKKKRSRAKKEQKVRPTDDCVESVLAASTSLYAAPSNEAGLEPAKKRLFTIEKESHTMSVHNSIVGAAAAGSAVAAGYPHFAAMLPAHAAAQVQAVQAHVAAVMAASAGGTGTASAADGGTASNSPQKKAAKTGAGATHGGAAKRKVVNDESGVTEEEHKERLAKRRESYRKRKEKKEGEAEAAMPKTSSAQDAHFGRSKSARMTQETPFYIHNAATVQKVEKQVVEMRDQSRLPPRKRKFSVNRTTIAEKAAENAAKTAIAAATGSRMQFKNSKAEEAVETAAKSAISSAAYASSGDIGANRSADDPFANSFSQFSSMPSTGTSGAMPTNVAYTYRQGGSIPNYSLSRPVSQLIHHSSIGTSLVIEPCMKPVRVNDIIASPRRNFRG